jgi:hypothetical protein
MSKRIAEVITEAFTTANLLDTDYDVVIVKTGEDVDTITHSVTLHSFQQPSKKLTVEFQHGTDNFVVDIFASYNTLLFAKQFKKFFEVCFKYETISFE